MKKEFYFHIPQPCHEDWNKMTPAAKGRFCESCSKQVVDFSLMTDHEVLNYFSKKTGKVCGRFANDQLQRPFAEAKHQRKKTWWVAMIMPLLLLVNKVNAQKKGRNIKQDTSIIKSEPREEIMGKVASSIMPVGDIEIKGECNRTIGDSVITMNKPAKEKKLTIKGAVTDERNVPIAFACIRLKNEKTGTASDANGNFSLTIPFSGDNITLVISSVGYEEKEIPIATGHISATTQTNEEPEIIVANENLKMREQIMGGLVVVTAGYTTKHSIIKKKDTLSTTVQKIFRNQFFKINPNPAPKGSTLNIEIKKAGEYSIQLLDVNSKPILVKDFIVASDKAVARVNIPSSLASGMYYIRVIDEKKKKQYADKLIVQ